MEGIPVESEKGIVELYEDKMNAALDRDCDDRGMVEYSSVQLLDLLAEVGQKAGKIAVDKNHAATQLSRLRRGAKRLRQQAEQAEWEHREDLARQALIHREAILARLPDMEEEEAALRDHGDKLSDAERGMRDTIEKFRAREERLLGSGHQMHIQAGIADIFAKIRNEIENADIAARLAEDDVTNLKSQAHALHDLIMPGAMTRLLRAAGRSGTSTRQAPKQWLRRNLPRLGTGSTRTEGTAPGVRLPRLDKRLDRDVQLCVRVSPASALA